MANRLNRASYEKIKTDLDNLSCYNSTPGVGITRVLFTEEEIAGRSYIKRRMLEIGLAVREDVMGNIFGSLEGSEPALPEVWTGSHIDTVLHGGEFDGTIGVIGGLEALRLIKESGIPHRRTLSVVVFTSEEPTRFGMGCLGSRALAGALTRENLSTLIDREGESLESLLLRLGYDLSQYESVKRAKSDVHGFVELHIEQGAVLESLKIGIGVVTTISAPTDLNIKVKGRQGHAGATPMSMRNDALAAAAEIILKLEAIATADENPSTVATVGKLSVYPGASNVIPGAAEFTIDIRSSDFESKARLLEQLRLFFAQLAADRGVEIAVEMICHDQPMKADARIVKAIAAACDDLGVRYHSMVSGAYHDAMMVARFAPIGMIFVPSRGGISHDPQEWSDYSDIATGTDILAKALLKLSND